MRLRKAISAVVAGLGLVALSAGLSPAQGPPRLSFQLATGSTAGSYFPMGELIGGIVSHPPGLGRCEKEGSCGPLGLIVSARTSEGAVANVLAVNSGLIDSGLAQSNVVADAVAGKGAFRKAGRQRHIRVIASLFPETVHLIVAGGSPITKVADLRGRRVSLGTDGSGASVIAREILKAYWISERSLKVSRASYDASAALLQQGKLDAFFFVGGTPSPLVSDLLARGKGRLIAIEGKARRRLLRRVPSLFADAIPAGAYPGTGAIPSVASRTLWVVKDSASPDLVYGLVRALFHPANRALIDADGPSARQISLASATKGVTAPLHPGAQRFYRERGKLPVPRPSPRKK